MNRRRKRFSPDEIARIRTLTEAGWTDPEIAVALGRTSGDSVCLIRRQHKIAAGGWRPYTAAEDLAIREAVEAGFSSREIADAVGRTQRAINSRRHGQRIEAPVRGPQQIAAEVRRDLHVARLLEKRRLRGFE